jgi:hypothetical protein
MSRARRRDMTTLVAVAATLGALIWMASFWPK